MARSSRELRPELAKEFELEKQQLLETFGDKILAIEHIGGTSILGLVAKPIIDIVVAVKSLTICQSL